MVEVAAAIIMKDDHQILIAQRGEGQLANKWEFPGGKREAGESFEQCLQREIMEELGITIEVGECFGVSYYGRIKLVAFMARWLAGQITPMVHRQIRWVDVRELATFDFAPADLPFVEKLQQKCMHTG